jgi:hypothetical protein
MQTLSDLSRSLAVLEPDVTLIAVIEMSLSLRKGINNLASFRHAGKPRASAECPRNVFSRCSPYDLGLGAVREGMPS